MDEKIRLGWKLFFVVFITMSLVVIVYKDIFFMLHTYYYEDSICEYNVPADLNYNVYTKGKYHPNYYSINIYLKNAKAKYNIPYVLYINDEAFPKIKDLYKSNEGKKIYLDVRYKYHKYLPSNFDTTLIPIEIKLNSNKNIVFSSVEAEADFFSDIAFMFIFCTIFFVGALFFVFMLVFPAVIS